MSITPIAIDVVTAGLQEEIGQSMSPAKQTINRENPALAQFIANAIEEKKIRERFGRSFTFGQDNRGRSKGLIDLLNDFNTTNSNRSNALTAMAQRNESMGKIGSVKYWARTSENERENIGL